MDKDADWKLLLLYFFRRLTNYGETMRKKSNTATDFFQKANCLMKSREFKNMQYTMLSKESYSTEQDSLIPIGNITKVN